MRYQTTVLLTAEVMADVRAGRRRLQCGQWVIIPGSARPSRWVGVLRGAQTIWAAHYQGEGEGGYQAQQFRAMAGCRRNDRKSFL
jgi:hypothetical protein